MVKGKGGFLFISHSHKDMDKIRELRNRLEEEGYEPLCFYLKCLDDSPNELDDLIKREIDARQWFLYAVSPNSEDSEYVQMECEHRRNSNNNQIWEWHLEKDSLDDIFKIISEGLRVNLIYSHKDIEFTLKLASELRKRDLQVTFDEGLKTGWEAIEENITEASKYGANIVILSKNSIESVNLRKEIYFAAQSDSLIIPVYIEEVELKYDLILLLLSHISIFNEKPIKDDNDMDIFIDNVVEEIQWILDEKFNEL